MLIYFLQTNGGVAQLGERLNGIQEVMGSIPTVSTTIEQMLKTRKLLAAIAAGGFFVFSIA